MSPARRLRETITASGLARVMAAHSPLSALLAQEAGFDGVWASGFELSALYGLPDASLVTMSQHLDMTRAIAARTSIPIVADLDTGFGNAVNLFHAIEDYERAGVAALVVEDKTFPKMTSLVADGRQELVRTAEFQGKIAAARAARKDPDLVIIARTEALIAGLGLHEALSRAAAYTEAGADMILIHSKRKTPDEVESFVRAWTQPVPLVVVPTSYPAMDEARIRSLGKIGMTIYGNHAVRAAAAAMRDVFARIRRDGGAQGVQDLIAPVEEIFRLQRMDELAAREKAYLR